MFTCSESDAQLARMSGADEAVVMSGCLKEVNSGEGTARLYDSVGAYIRLRFDPGIDAEMRQFATQYVKVIGVGRFNRQGNWDYVAVERIHRTRCWDEPFDLDSLARLSCRTVFDPETVITTSDPFDVDEFIKIIHQARDGGWYRSKSM